MIKLEIYADKETKIDIYKIFGESEHSDLYIKTIVDSRENNLNEIFQSNIYGNIQSILELRYQDPLAQEALFYIFFRFIKKMVGIAYFSIHDNLRMCINYWDVLQYSCELFYEFIDRYDSEKAQFSYYIKQWFKVYLKAEIKKWLVYYKKIVRMGYDTQTKRGLVIKKDHHHNEVISIILWEDIYKLIKKEELFSDSRAKVCKDIFLKGKSVTQLAEERGVSYHAVYQQVYKIKILIADMLNKNKYCSYKISVGDLDRNLFDIRLKN